MKDGIHNESRTDSETETLNVTAHRDEETWFCGLKPHDERVHDHIVEIETEFGRADTDRRVISELVLERKREGPPPVVGTVEHDDGELVSIDIDLSEWYGEGSHEESCKKTAAQNPTTTVRVEVEMQCVVETNVE